MTKPRDHVTKSRDHVIKHKYTKVLHFIFQSLLRETEHSEIDGALSRIIDSLTNLNLPSSVIDKSILESAVSECNDDVKPEDSDKVRHFLNSYLLFIYLFYLNSVSVRSSYNLHVV